jgi:hypothetical protein
MFTRWAPYSISFNTYANDDVSFDMHMFSCCILLKKYTESMEIYRYLLDLLPLSYSNRMTIITACNRLANKCSIELDDRYKPCGHLSSRDYPKATTQISAFDVDQALHLITQAENFLHEKNVCDLIPMYCLFVFSNFLHLFVRFIF